MGSLMGCGGSVLGMWRPGWGIGVLDEVWGSQTMCVAPGCDVGVPGGICKVLGSVWGVPDRVWGVPGRVWGSWVAYGFPDRMWGT